jgi:predicted glutamine amidotransferase
MTSYARQDARENAGILKGKSHGYGYGTTTSRHVRFDANEKETHEDYNSLTEWDKLREYHSMSHPVPR